MSQVTVNILSVWSVVIVGAFTFVGVCTVAYEVWNNK
jgi:hypothetical protein